MGAPLRSSEEITLIVNRAQHAIGDIGYELVKSSDDGTDQSNTDFRDKMYRLIMLRIFLQNILDDDGNIINYYTDEDNKKKFNNILDGIARLSQFYGGAAIPLITGKRIPLYIFPTTVVPVAPPLPVANVEALQATINTPSGIVDSFSTTGNFVMYVYSASGSNSGEGSRSGVIIVNIRAGVSNHFELKGSDNGGITSPLVFSTTIVSGQLRLIATVSTSGWTVKATRITFD